MKALFFSCVSFVLLASGIFVGDIQRKCLHSKSDDGCERNATNWECLCSDAAGCNGRNTLVAEGAGYSVEASASVMILSAFIAIQHFVMQ
ncbi:hypothetical protein MAR_036245 [Mya arenaria]|uniref:Uncharacterized protein n=1 Tax=Mya arenaria TaxID=6604 RepID=A0ABY7EQE2_MYAAR|nr:hypothetical protein MAR_036245 [Mya arenaria]